MSDVFKAVGGLFGFGGDEAPPEEIRKPIDPVAERRALAELNVGNVEDIPAAPPGGNAGSSAVGKDGTVDFDLLFSQAGFLKEEFTADHAVKLIAKVEKTIPTVISDPKERDSLLRNVIVATMSGPANPDQIVKDAQRRTDTLNNLIRNRLDLAADFRQRAQDKIKSLEEQIAAGKAAIESADQQFTNLSKSCKERQAQYARLIELFQEGSQDSPA